MALVKLQAILGQSHAKDLLFRSFAKGKVSHAYIFRGPAGVGKKSTALSYAAYLNCGNRQEQDFCGVCSSCLKFASGNHPDFHLMEPDDSAIKIAQVRELKKLLTFPPFEAEYRVVLFPDIHLTMKRKEVANSLLKTLEEPPANTIIILTADEAGEVLPTILSRSQIVRFVPLRFEDVSAKLLELKEIGRSEAYTLAAVSGGSLGQALAIADQELLNLRRQLVEVIMHLDKNQGDAVEKIFAMAQQMAELKGKIFDFFALLRLWIRDLVLLASVKSEDLIVNQDLRPTYKGALERWELPELFQKLQAIDLAKKQLDRNCNRVSVCEILLWDFL